MIIQIEPWIDHEELEQLKRVVDSTYVTEHDLTHEFEEKIRELTGSKHAIAMTNGTAALYCCLKAVGVGEGDEVVVPNITFAATANAVLLAGGIPVFADIDPKTLTISSETISRVMTPKTKAVIPVHLYGRSANMEDLVDFCKARSLIIIEDAAQGVGVKFNNRHVGTFGVCGVLSFYGNKTITCGEGGIVLTDSDDIARECFKLKNHGRSKKGTFVHESVGFNFCFTEMQAAIGISQLGKLGRIVERKKQIRQKYEARLANIYGVELLNLSPSTDHVFWFTSILVGCAGRLQVFLRNSGIQSRRAFYPLNEQPCYQPYGLPNRDRYVESMSFYNRLLSLPSSYNITEEELDLVIYKIGQFMKTEQLDVS